MGRKDESLLNLLVECPWDLGDVDHNIHSYYESGRGRAERSWRNVIARDRDRSAKIWLRANGSRVRLLQR